MHSTVCVIVGLLHQHYRESHIPVEQYVARGRLRSSVKGCYFCIFYLHKSVLVLCVSGFLCWVYLDRTNRTVMIERIEKNVVKMN